MTAATVVGVALLIGLGLILVYFVIFFLVWRRQEQKKDRLIEEWTALQRAKEAREAGPPRSNGATPLGRNL